MTVPSLDYVANNTSFDAAERLPVLKNEVANDVVSGVVPGLHERLADHERTSHGRNQIDQRIDFAYGLKIDLLLEGDPNAAKQFFATS